MKKFIYIIPILLILFACEEDVVLDLGDIEKRFVVEAKITNQNPAVEVALSYSQNFYDTPNYKLIKNATVKIISPDGLTSEELQINENSIYTTKDLKPILGQTYQLQINVDDTQVEVSTLLPHELGIRDVLFVPNSFYDSTDSLNVFVNIIDEKDVDNYFRLFVNKMGDEPTNEYYVTDDSFGKNDIVTLPIYYKNFTWGDTVIVELRNLNYETYQYYTTLSENLGGSFNSIAPGNPLSNMPADVFGYFAGYTVDIDTLIVTAPFPPF